MLNIYFWSVVVFFAILAVLIYRDRKKIEFHNYVLAMRKTKRGRHFIYRVADASPGFWKALSTIAVLVAFFLMAYGLYMILLSTQLILAEIITVPAIQLILPVPQAQPISGFGFIGVPFWFWILIVPFVLFPHEFAHGIIARVNKVRIKSVGLIQLLIFSGAFVEPDENQIKKSNLMSKLRIFSVGSIANITIALVFIILTKYLLWPSFVPTGVVITEVMEGSGAEAAGLRPSMVLQEMDGYEINVEYDIFSATYGYLLFKGYNMTSENIWAFSTRLEVGSVISEFEPGQTINVRADDVVYDLTLSGRPENSSLPYMGIMASADSNNDFMFEFMFPLIWWLSTLSYFIAIFNLLPIYPLDGGLMVEAVAEKVSRRHAKRIVKAITIAVLLILIFNFLGPSVIGSLFT
jgi:membrane-associated protease RseP (regulator of RpoE activity)